MDPVGTVTLPLHGGIERRAVVGLAARHALDEAHGLAVDDVDGWQEY